MTNVKKQIEIFSSEGLFQLTTQTMKKCSHNEMHVHDGHQSVEIIMDIVMGGEGKEER